MDVQQLIEQFGQAGAYTHMLAVLLGMPRLFMLLMIAPFFGGGIVTGQLRTALAFSLYLFLHPAVAAEVAALQREGFTFSLQLGVLLVKEVFIGFLMAWLSGILFWAVVAAGSFIDAQRGASQSQESDPLTGEETTPMGSLLFQGSVYLFFSSGAFLALLGVVYASYLLWPVTAFLPVAVFYEDGLVLFFASRVAWLMSSMLLLAGPIMVACLLTDVSLGLINRAAQQLNVYVLAMPIKSALAAFLLVFYFGVLMGNPSGLFGSLFTDMETLHRLVPGQ